jgi:CheY-like chemotaxis protein
MLPDRDGWTVLDRLKYDADTSHIPVHIISSGDEQRQRAIKMGAFTQLQKPVSREQLAEASTTSRPSCSA